MTRLLLAASVATLAIASFGRAADPKPTPEELEEIRHQTKQLAVYVYSAEKLIAACNALSGYGAKARSAVPVLLETLHSPDHKSERVQVAAAEAIAEIGGPLAEKAFVELAKHAVPGVRAAAKEELARMARGPVVAKAVGRPAGWDWGRYLTPDTTAVIDLRLRSALDVLSVKNKSISRKLRKELENGGLWKAFKFEPMRDVTDVAFVLAKDNTGVTVLGGRFDDAPKGTVIDVSGFGMAGHGVCVSNTTLLLVLCPS